MKFIQKTKKAAEIKKEIKITRKKLSEALDFSENRQAAFLTGKIAGLEFALKMEVKL